MSDRHKWADVIHAFAEGKEIQWRFISLKSGEISIWEDIPKIQDPQFNNSCIEWRVKPHKYQEVIDAYLRGETVQSQCKTEWSCGWLDLPRGKNLDIFDAYREFRIKPKPDIVKTGRLYLNDEDYLCWGGVSRVNENVKFIFDGETKELKEVRLWV